MSGCRDVIQASPMPSPLKARLAGDQHGPGSPTAASDFQESHNLQWLSDDEEEDMGTQSYSISPPARGPWGHRLDRLMNLFRPIDNHVVAEGEGEKVLRNTMAKFCMWTGILRVFFAMSLIVAVSSPYKLASLVEGETRRLQV